jgi:hypothetical protein
MQTPDKANMEQIIIAVTRKRAILQPIAPAGTPGEVIRELLISAL